MNTAQNRDGHIRQLCARLTHEFKPEKIILFGSHACGQPTAASDLDLLVVMPFEGDPLEQAAAMLNRLNVLVPMDVSVRTPEQIQQRLAMGDRFMGDILERGPEMTSEGAASPCRSLGKDRTMSLEDREDAYQSHTTPGACSPTQADSAARLRQWLAPLGLRP